MSPRLRKGLIVAAIHVALVASLGAKMLVDRATRPRVWARVLPIDPDLPIRGRYVRLAIEGAADASVRSVYNGSFRPAVRDGGLVFVPAGPRDGFYGFVRERDGRYVVELSPRLAFFIPEHVPDPSVRAPGEELWVEVTVPRRGLPRPIRLGVKKSGVLAPLDGE
jgi:hypothetical protein